MVQQQSERQPWYFSELLYRLQLLGIESTTTSILEKD